MNDDHRVALVGDVVISRPISMLLAQDAAFGATIELLRSAAATTGNLETTIIDVDGFVGSPYGDSGDWVLTAVPSAASDLRLLGFDLLSRANNHSLDWGVAGMRETSKRLDAAGIVHAGTGEHRAQARAARYVETPYGRIGLVSATSTFPAHSEALPPHGRAPGRPGISGLRISRLVQLPREGMDALRSLKAAMGLPRGLNTEQLVAARDMTDSAETSLFGMRFSAGDRPEYRYEVNRIDLAELLHSTRLGKQHSDTLILSIHAHQTDLSGERPADFLPSVARAGIDAGADIVSVHGLHRLMGIEIYRGRPIFLGLGNFIWSDLQEPLAADQFEDNRELLAASLGLPARGTDADLTAILNSLMFNDPRVFQSVVAICRFAGQKLTAIELHPLDLGYGRSLTSRGIPRLAEPDVVNQVLQRLQELSEPYGTEILVENRVGIVRLTDNER